MSSSPKFGGSWSELGDFASSDAKISCSKEKPPKNGEWESEDKEKEKENWFEDIREVLGEEAYWKELYSEPDDDEPPSPDFVHSLTVAEYQDYVAAVEASEGFDVPDLRGKGAFNLIHPYSVRDVEAYLFKRLCDAAIADFNRIHGSGYEYVKVLKVNKQTDVSLGYIYYITFEAAAAPAIASIGTDTVTFQTKVMEAFWVEEPGIGKEEEEEEDFDNYPILVHFCRLATSSHNNTRGW